MPFIADKKSRELATNELATVVHVANDRAELVNSAQQENSNTILSYRSAWVVRGGGGVARVAVGSHNGVDH